MASDRGWGRRAETFQLAVVVLLLDNTIDLFWQWVTAVVVLVRINRLLCDAKLVNGGQSVSKKH